MLPSEVEAIRKRHPTARGPIIGSLYGGNLTILLSFKNLVSFDSAIPLPKFIQEKQHGKFIKMHVVNASFIILCLCLHTHVQQLLTPIQSTV